MEAHSSVLAFRAIELHDCQKTTSLYAVLQYKVMLDAGSNHADKILVESIQRRQTGLSFVVHAMLLKLLIGMCLAPRTTYLLYYFCCILICYKGT